MVGEGFKINKIKIIKYRRVGIDGTFAFLDARVSHKIPHPTKQVQHSVADVCVNGLDEWSLLKHFIFILNLIVSLLYKCV